MDQLEGLIEELRQFVREREWARFHDPKNLAMAIASEAGELLAEYRWVDNAESDDWSSAPDNRDRVSREAADVAIALLLFCDRIGVDLAEAVRTKIETNRRNYPAGVVRGKPERPGTGGS